MDLVQREILFSFAHRLPGYEGRCRYLHGHDARALLVAAGELDGAGMVVDFAALKRFGQTWVAETLADRPVLQAGDPLIEPLRAAGSPVAVLDAPPTTEMLARAMVAAARAEGLPIVRVHLWETARAMATYPASEPPGIAPSPGKNVQVIRHAPVTRVAADGGGDAPASGHDKPHDPHGAASGVAEVTLHVEVCVARRAPAGSLGPVGAITGHNVALAVTLGPNANVRGCSEAGASPTAATLRADLQAWLNETVDHGLALDPADPLIATLPEQSARLLQVPGGSDDTALAYFFAGHCRARLEGVRSVTMTLCHGARSVTVA